MLCHRKEEQFLKLVDAVFTLTLLEGNFYFLLLTWLMCSAPVQVKLQVSLQQRT